MGAAMSDQVMYTIRDVAKILGVSTLVVRKWIKSDPPQLQAERVGLRVMISAGEVQRILRGDPLVP